MRLNCPVVCDLLNIINYSINFTWDCNQLTKDQGINYLYYYFKSTFTRLVSINRWQWQVSMLPLHFKWIVGDPDQYCTPVIDQFIYSLLVIHPPSLHSSQLTDRGLLLCSPVPHTFNHPVIHIAPVSQWGVKDIGSWHDSVR